jgi:hypothetical protein
MNRRFGRASAASGRELFEARDGGRLQRATIGYGRVIAIVVGSALAVLGFLGAAGVL